MNTIKILLVDDHPIVREGYRRLLERQPGFIVCAEADNAKDAYKAFSTAQPDVVIMDLHLPGAGGLEAVRHIRQRDSHARILIFTMQLSAAYALKAFEAGASGYVTKSRAAAEVVRAVADIAKGRRVISDDVSKAIAADRLAGSTHLTDGLSARETEILSMIARGIGSDEIAGLLHLSQKTVRNHHYTIKTKIDARNDAHLVWLAIGAGLFEFTHPQVEQLDDADQGLPPKNCGDRA